MASMNSWRTNILQHVWTAEIAPSRPQRSARMADCGRGRRFNSRGGFNAIKLTLEDAGAAFSPEQIAEIQPLLKDSQGPETLAKIIKLLTPAQRAALRR